MLDTPVSLFFYKKYIIPSKLINFISKHEKLFARLLFNINEAMHHPPDTGLSD